jgi:putative membrane protein
MQTRAYTRRLLLIPAALALAVACGGDANEQGAATDTLAATGTAGGDVGAANAVNPAEAVAFMTAVDSSEIQAARIATSKATNAEVRGFAQTMIRDHTRSSREIAQLAQSVSGGQSTAGTSPTAGSGTPGAAGTATTPGAPGTPGSMVANVQTMAQQTMQQLNSTPKGAEFDRLYMDSQVQAHQAALDNLQRIANPGGTTTAGTGAAGATTPATGTAGTAGTAGATTGAHTAGHTAAAGQSGSVSTPEQAAQKMIPVVQQHLDRARQIQSRLAGSR